MLKVNIMRKGLAVCLLTAAVSMSATMPATVYAGSTSSSNNGSDICGTAGERCNHFIETYINPFIILLSGLVGVLAVISIIVAGIQYAGSADDPATVSKAKKRIFNTVIGVLAYLLLFAFLNYLIPGGIL